jgi:hypothetical protein
MVPVVLSEAVAQPEAAPAARSVPVAWLETVGPREAAPAVQQEQPVAARAVPQEQPAREVRPGAVAAVVVVQRGWPSAEQLVGSLDTPVAPLDQRAVVARVESVAWVARFRFRPRPRA